MQVVRPIQRRCHERGEVAHNRADARGEVTPHPVPLRGCCSRHASIIRRAPVRGPEAKVLTADRRPPTGRPTTSGPTDQERTGPTGQVRFARRARRLRAMATAPAAMAKMPDPIHRSSGWPVLANGGDPLGVEVYGPVDVVLPGPVVPTAVVEVELVVELEPPGVEVPPPVVVVELGTTDEEVVVELGTIDEEVDVELGTIDDVVVVGGAFEQSGSVKVSVSRVTAPLRASARPSTATPVFTVMEVRAMMLPTKTELVPRVAELPTCQYTLQAKAPLISETVLPEAVMSVESVWKIQTALELPSASSTSGPVRPRADLSGPA